MTVDSGRWSVVRKQMNTGYESIITGSASTELRGFDECASRLLITRHLQFKVERPLQKAPSAPAERMPGGIDFRLPLQAGGQQIFRVMIAF